MRKRITTDTNSYFRHKSTRTPLALRTPFGIEGRTCISADRSRGGSPRILSHSVRVSAALRASRSANRARASSGGGRHLGASIRSDATDRDRDPMANPSNSEQPSYSASHGHKNGHRRVWRDGVASRVATLDDLPTQCRHEARVLDQDWLDGKNHCGAGVFGERAGTRTRDLLIKSEIPRGLTRSTKTRTSCTSG